MRHSGGRLYANTHAIGVVAVTETHAETVCQQHMPSELKPAKMK